MLQKFLSYITLIAIAVIVVSCGGSGAPKQLSEEPAESTGDTLNPAIPREGRIGLRSRISYTDIKALIDSTLPASYPIKDERRVCKKLFGLQVCGTAQWDLQVNQYGDLEVSGEHQKILIQAPIAFDGNVGIDGRVAKTLGLANLAVSGSVLADIKLGVNIDEQWCPKVDVSVEYDWTEAPKAIWRDSVDVSLETIVNEALDKQLSSLEPKINESIDCDVFREELQSYWQSYSFAFDLPSDVLESEINKMYLNFTPTAFNFSGLHTQENKLGFGFAIDGTTVFEPQAAEKKTLTLPELRNIDYQDSTSKFDILIRATYEQLEQLIRPAMQGKRYSSDTIAGEAAITINTAALSGNNQSVTVSLNFTANLPGKNKDTQGTLYLTARPTVNSAREEIYLEEVKITKILDSKLWDLIGSIFENQIVEAIERNSTISYSSRLRDIEDKISLQLKDETRTAGLLVLPTDIAIEIVEIIPESTSLAAIARVSAELDIDVPLKLINTPIQ